MQVKYIQRWDILKIIENELLSKHTSYKIGGPARYFCEPIDENELIEVLKWIEPQQMAVKILANGSNILVSDEGVDALVIKLKQQFRQIDINKEYVYTGGGTGLHQLIETLAAEGYGGFEKLACIPGSIAGALVMNAGAYGISIGRSVISSQIITISGEKQSLTNDQLAFHYRSSIFQNNHDLIIVGTRLKIEPKPKELLQETMTDIRERRKKHPILPSAGSVFRNPSGKFAGEIIEKLGLKGSRCGEGQISPQHANFIVNLGNASANDIYNLICMIQDKALLDESILLEPEIKLWGNFRKYS